MVDIQLIKTNQDTGRPQRLVKFILYWCGNGTASVTIDGNKFELKKNEAITITSGQFQQVERVRGNLTALTFTMDFFCKTDNDIELIFHNGLFCHFGMNEIIAVNNIDLFSTTLKKLQEEIDNKPYQWMVSTHAHIALLLVELNRSKIARGEEIWKPDALFLKFLEEVRQHFAAGYTVAAFAKRLATTEAKLNELSKLHTSKTAQNVIYSLTISEAKRLLRYENYSIKEIAYQLGFNDPFYFSNFFKKHTGTSPEAFKKTFSV